MMSKIVLALAFATLVYAQRFNSNPRQQDHSGGYNFQLDTTGNSRQYIGPGGGAGPVGGGARPIGGGAIGVGAGPYGGGGAGPYGDGFNSNPRQQDHSGGAGNVQIDTTGNSRQFIGGNGPRGGGYGGGASAGLGGGFGGPPQVNVNGEDLTGLNVQRPGLHVNQRPY